MRSALARQLVPAFDPRPGALADLEGLTALEDLLFTTDRISRRSFRHFLTTPNAALIVAGRAGELAGYALVLFHPRSAAARLYSIAVEPRFAGHGAGPLLLAAAESAAGKRGYALMRLEVRVSNAAAIALYRKAGYRQFGQRAGYYDDGEDALRFDKPLYPPRPAA
ncbi:MAG: GNAT family N-acetyltransferase [Pseudolabrys sp.]